MTGEHFIPLTKAALTELLLKRAAPAERDQLRDLCRMLEATLHYEYHAQLEQLCQQYQPCNPDSDKLSREDTSGNLDDFFPRLRHLAHKANYHSLSREQMQSAVASATAWGVALKVDYDQYDELVVFARGDDEQTTTVRSWRTWFRPVEALIPTYRRLLIAFRLRDDKTRSIFIKLFKNIPHGELEKLLPGGKVSMTWLDHAKVFAPTATGIAITVYKISKGALLLAFAGVYGMLAFLGLVGATIGYGVRSFFGYVRARDRYRLSLTENLYYQNLDNNAGVIFRLLYEAEAQEFCEAALAYFVLWHDCDGQPQSLEQLDKRAEEMLDERTGGPIDFEASDALDKLLRWGLVEEDAEKRFTAVPIDRALAKLDAAWDAYFHHPEVTSMVERMDV